MQLEETPLLTRILQLGIGTSSCLTKCRTMMANNVYTSLFLVTVLCNVFSIFVNGYERKITCIVSSVYCSIIAPMFILMSLTSLYLQLYYLNYSYTEVIDYCGWIAGVACVTLYQVKYIIHKHTLVFKDI